MTQKTYVIGDIAGQYRSLMALVAQFEPGSRIISVGDVIGRGPQSKEVVQYLRKNQIETLMGNHEHMALYSPGDWAYNGAGQTLASFGGSLPAAVREWMAGLPKRLNVSYGEQTFVVTHAPIPSPNGLRWREEPVELRNRYDPVRIPGVALQIHGHNARFEEFKDAEGLFAVCIDTSHQDRLTSIELPSMRYVTVPLMN